MNKEMELIETVTTWRWKVINFSKLSNTCTSSFRLKDDIKARFILNPFGRLFYLNDEPQVTIIADFPNQYIFQEHTEKEKYNAKCDFFIKTIDNDKMKLLKEAFLNEMDSSINSIKRSELLANKEKYLPNDCLTILCEVSYETTTPGGNMHISNFDVPKNRQHELFKLLIDNQTIGETTTVRLTNNEEIQVLKGVLIFHSPVFAAMFNHDCTQEYQNNLVITKQVKPEVFKQILFFMLTGELPESNVNFKELLAAANMYQMDRLKALCEKALYNEITIGNASEYFVDADKYDAQQLRLAAKEFIKKHIGGVAQTDGYAVMKQTYPQLVIEIFEELTLKKKES